MYSFKNDYSEGAHPLILESLLKTNLQQEPGYCLDQYSNHARELIKNTLECDSCDVHLIVGGTQTNLIAISSFLRPHEACIAAYTGHIAVHEAGAIEATGHKVITVNVANGKLDCSDIQAVVDGHPDEHMVKPKLVYISNPTELGTHYTKSELVKLKEYCSNNNLLLYIDGARLGSALVASDLEFKDLVHLADAIFIGATKNGALIGEALVICNDYLKKDLRYQIKQKGALLSKGRLLGQQFEVLFQNNLYLDLAMHAKKMADKLRYGLKKQGIKLLVETETNQLFPIFSKEDIRNLEFNFLFYVWKEIDENYSAIRLITSWATTEEAVDSFLETTKILEKS
ncbi:threonine aldolase family protein [Helicovermis profundi]|uniref:Low specificity L-threonine aldolase n=1 Tax=Helicovermis profundi TaxID=3065157 RepID=A0AAU9ENH1_9FIRM|nr:low specificity L-threonine aldolase [Clostridia bacterium S502]